MTRIAVNLKRILIQPHPRLPPDVNSQAVQLHRFPLCQKAAQHPTLGAAEKASLYPVREWQFCFTKAVGAGNCPGFGVLRLRVFLEIHVYFLPLLGSY